MKTYVLYHKNCFDGFGAAFAAWKKFGDNATYIAVTYGDPLPKEIRSGSDVFIVDFCFPTDLLLELNSRTNVIVLDHHEGAKQHLEASKCTCVFDQKRSGAKITWDYFFPNEKNEVIEYISDKDLWNFELPDSLAINYAIESQPKKFEVWDKFDLNLLRVEGLAIKMRVDEDIATISKKAFKMSFKGHTIPVVNTSHLNSEVGMNLLKLNPEALFSATYYDFWRNDKLCRKWSLRSHKDGFDVNKLCAEFGGGGHQPASGFIEEIESFSK